MGRVFYLEEQPPWSGWTAADLAALEQLRQAFARAGYDLEWSDGRTDQGEPWAAACTREDQELVVHVTRFNRRYYALDEQLNLVASGPSLANVTHRFLADRRVDPPTNSDLFSGAALAMWLGDEGPVGPDSLTATPRRDAASGPGVDGPGVDGPGVAGASSMFWWGDRTEQWDWPGPGDAASDMVSGPGLAVEAPATDRAAADDGDRPGLSEGRGAAARPLEPSDDPMALMVDPDMGGANGGATATASGPAGLGADFVIAVLVGQIARAGETVDAAAGPAPGASSGGGSGAGGGGGDVGMDRLPGPAAVPNGAPVDTPTLGQRPPEPTDQTPAAAPGTPAAPAAESADATGSDATGDAVDFDAGSDWIMLLLTEEGLAEAWPAHDPVDRGAHSLGAVQADVMGDANNDAKTFQADGHAGQAMLETAWPPGLATAADPLLEWG